jgi:hypothetical protein
MPRYEFLGDYPANAGLPDGSVVYTEPGQVHDLGDLFANDEGAHEALWAATEKPVTDVTPPPEPDPAVAPDQPSPQELPVLVTPTEPAPEPAQPEPPAAPDAAPAEPPHDAPTPA